MKIKSAVSKCVLCLQYVEHFESIMNLIVMMRLLLLTFAKISFTLEFGKTNKNRTKLRNLKHTAFIETMFTQSKFCFRRYKNTFLWLLNSIQSFNKTILSFYLLFLHRLKETKIKIFLFRFFKLEDWACTEKSLVLIWLKNKAKKIKTKVTFTTLIQANVTIQGKCNLTKKIWYVQLKRITSSSMTFARSRDVVLRTFNRFPKTLSIFCVK